MTTPVKGQKMNAAQIAKGEAIADKILKGVNHVDDADSFAAAITRFVANNGVERGLSQEQQVFAVAVATIHLRNTFPGGKDRFDELCRAAQDHYDKDG